MLYLLCSLYGRDRTDKVAFRVGGHRSGNSNYGPYYRYDSGSSHVAGSSSIACLAQYSLTSSSHSKQYSCGGLIHFWSPSCRWMRYLQSPLSEYSWSRTVVIVLSLTMLRFWERQVFWRYRSGFHSLQWLLVRCPFPSRGPTSCVRVSSLFI